MTFNFKAVSDILACPKCRGELVFIGESLICDSDEHRLQFPIVDGIPRLLVEESVTLSDDQWALLKNQTETTL
ncbi:MAG: hypothetical protein MK110_09665 [Fuerstiella sp.]|nr:hypothetical protein [Fuerstiella sp.]